MRRLQYNLEINFFKEGKFVFLLGDEVEMGTSEERVLEEFKKVYDCYGEDINWNISIVDLYRGSERADLEKKIKELSIKHREEDKNELKKPEFQA
jgi:hypothetical protein